MFELWDQVFLWRYASHLMGASSFNNLYVKPTDTQFHGNKSIMVLELNYEQKIPSLLIQPSDENGNTLKPHHLRI